MKFAYAIAFVGIAAVVAAKDPPCMKECAGKFDPVCGFDGKDYKMFANKCYMDNEACKDGKTWAARLLYMCVAKPRSADCPQVCPANYAPVCGFDGLSYKEFPNKCMFEVELCTDSKPWTLTTMDNCEVKKSNPCPQICPAIYAPVCGFDGLSYKEFPNKCMFEVELCTDSKPWTLTAMDNCEVKKSNPCPQICPAIYAPVCGFDGLSYKEFPNKCMFEVELCTDSKPWTLTTMDHCEVKQSKPCPKICPAIYAPVCGFDGLSYKEFPNKCMFEVELCTDSKPWTLTTMDHCEVKKSKPCPKICPAIYAPVCGFDGLSYKEFPNKCMFEVELCTDSKPWTLTTMDHCEVKQSKACPKICPDIYAPVCGFNGDSYKVFDNKCFFEFQSCTDSQPWTMTTMAECSSPRVAEEKQCNLACPYNYDPVCGFDGEKYVIFGNQCAFDSSNCLDSNKWNLLTLAQCEAHGVHAY